MGTAGRTPLLVIGGALVAAVLGAGVSSLMMRRVMATPTHKPAKVEVVPFTFDYPLGDQTVNLSEPGHYLKATIELQVLAKENASAVDKDAAAGAAKQDGEGDGKDQQQYLPPMAASVKADLDANRAEVLDAVVNELSSSSFSRLLMPEGKRDLRARIRKAVDAILSDGEIKNVYFTSFLVQ